MWATRNATRSCEVSNYAPKAQPRPENVPRIAQLEDPARQILNHLDNKATTLDEYLPAALPQAPQSTPFDVALPGEPVPITLI